MCWIMLDETKRSSLLRCFRNSVLVMCLHPKSDANGVGLGLPELWLSAGQPLLIQEPHRDSGWGSGELSPSCSRHRWTSLGRWSSDCAPLQLKMEPSQISSSLSRALAGEAAGLMCQKVPKKLGFSRGEAAGVHQPCWGHSAPQSSLTRCFANQNTWGSFVAAGCKHWQPQNAFSTAPCFLWEKSQRLRQKLRAFSF